MNQGIDISTSGVLTSMYRQDVLTSNLANLNTVGYKPSVPEVRQRDVAREEDGLWNWPSDMLLERLGAGVVPAETRVSFAQGSIETTGNPLDLAIRGEGFFAVQTEGGTALTRDGRLTLNERGELVLASTGHALQTEGGGTLVVQPGEQLAIASDGTVLADGVQIATLRFVDVADTSALTKQAAGLYALGEQGDALLQNASGQITQGAVEGSAVNEIDAIMQITSASRTVESNIGLIAYQNQLTQRAISTFGRLG